MGGISFQDALHELGMSWKLDNGDGMTRTWANRLPVGAAWGEQKIGMKVAWHELAWAKLVPWVTRACSTWATGAGKRDMTWAAMKNRINWHDMRKHELWHGQPWILARDNMYFGMGNHEFRYAWNDMTWASMKWAGMSPKHELAWATWHELTWSLTWAVWQEQHEGHQRHYME